MQDTRLKNQYEKQQKEECNPTNEKIVMLKSLPCKFEMIKKVKLPKTLDLANATATTQSRTTVNNHNTNPTKRSNNLNNQIKVG